MTAYNKDLSPTFSLSLLWRCNSIVNEWKGLTKISLIKSNYNE